ncbi:MAG: right-handed parallel beta-helix repeat-containing protein [Chloroflexi bacterium]|nr:right-handed parallel beta-helix repeat-containing protein [Chloroflexota bacterium]
MSSTDISRHLFDARKRYISVQMQQGRVFLDADWNENERIADDARRKAILDIVGGQGSPDGGYRISGVTGAGQDLDFRIEPGTYYLGGTRLDLDQPESFRAQTDWLDQPPGGIDPEHRRIDVVYLETWQQSVTAVEDSELLEVALGGPDTSTRIRNMSRVRVLRNVNNPDCADAWKAASERFAKAGRGQLNAGGELVTDAELTVTIDPGVVGSDPCDPETTGGYLGAENQAIRVQIVSPNTFTWGFDNGSALYRVSLSADRTKITFITEPRDQAHWPLAGDTVELLPWSALLPNGEKVAEHQGHLSRLASSFNPDVREVTMTDPPAAGFGQEWQARPDAALLGEEYFYLRVWHRGTDRTGAPAISFTAGTPVELGHTGLSITLDGSAFRPGDYWTIAARPNSPSEVMPWQLLTGASPIGPKIFVAPLALIQWRRRGRNFVPQIISDCRARFLPLTSTETCSTYTVGDGSHSRGHFDSIQAAINALPLKGGEIHVLPGVYRENVRIIRRRNVTVFGCGKDTRVIAPGGSEQPVFRIRDCRGVCLSSMAIETDLGIGVQLEQAAGISHEPGDDSPVEPVEKPTETIRQPAETLRKVDGAAVARLDIFNTSRGAVNLADAVNVSERFERVLGVARAASLSDLIDRLPQALEDIVLKKLSITVRDRQAIHGQGGDSITVEDCEIRIRQLTEDMNSETDAGRWPGIFLTADDLTITGNSIEVDERAGARRTALGGLQVGGGSDRVSIARNTIIGGNGRGITLGSIVYIPAKEPDLPRLDFSRFLRFAAFLPPGLNIVVDRRGCVIWTLNPPAPTDDDGSPLIPASTGSLSEVEIVGNRITSMAGSGISVAHFFDPTVTTDCITVSGLLIRDNIVRNCLQGDVAEASVSSRTFGAFGGITLGSALGLEIRHNTIEANGLSHVNPVCGIFVLYAEGALIDDNQIAGNGPRTNTDSVPRAGNRGGIVIAYARAPEAGNSSQTAILSAPEPAVRVHRNTVIAPEGRALKITASGQVVVRDNNLSSQGFGTRRSHGLLNRLSGSGSIEALRNLNINFDREEVNFSATGLSAALTDLAGGAVVYINSRSLGTNSKTGALQELDLKSGAPSGDQERSSVEQPVIRTNVDKERLVEAVKEAETASTESSEKAESDVAMNIAERLITTGKKGLAVLTENTAIARARIGAAGRQVTGSIMFSGNQVSLTLGDGDSDTPASAVILMSNGDVSASDNQIDAAVPVTSGFINTIVFGSSVRVIGNRFNEPLESGDDSMLSAATIGAAMNITTENEGAHCFYAYRSPNSNIPQVVDQPNLSMIQLVNPEACAPISKATVNIDPIIAVAWTHLDAMRKAASK